MAKVSVINLTEETRKNRESVKRENPEVLEKCSTTLIKYSQATAWQTRGYAMHD